MNSVCFIKTFVTATLVTALILHSAVALQRHAGQPTQPRVKQVSTFNAPPLKVALFSGAYPVQPLKSYFPVERCSKGYKRVV